MSDSGWRNARLTTASDRLATDRHEQGQTR